MSERDLSKPGEIKPQLSALLNTTGDKWKMCFCVLGDLKLQSEVCFLVNY